MRSPGIIQRETSAKGEAMLNLMVTNVRGQTRDFKTGGSLVELVELSVLKDFSQ